MPAVQTARMEFWYDSASAEVQSRLIEVYLETLSQVTSINQLNTTLLLVPSFQVRRHLLRQMALKSNRALLSPQVITFDDFARQILVDSHASLKLLSAPHKRLLLRELIAQAVKSNAWTKLAPIAETEGVVDLVDRFLIDLKREEIWPEKLTQWLQEQPGRQTERELEWLYTAYQNQLHDRKLYDAEGLFWLAREQLQQQPALLKKQRLVIAAGFVDFTWPQREMLKVIASRSERMIVTFLHQQHDQRTTLFRSSIVSEQRLRPLANGRQFTQFRATEASTDAVPAGLKQLKQSLFADLDDLTFDPAASHNGVRVIAAMGQRSEARMIAREIRTALNTGLTPDQIAIGLRQSSDLHAELIDVLTDAELPISSEFIPALTDSELVKALRRLFEVEQNDWNYRSLKALLRNRLFLQILPTNSSGETAAQQIDQLFEVLRAYGHRKGRLGLLKQLDNRIEKLTSHQDDLSENEENSNRISIEQLRTASKVLKRLDDILSRFRNRKTIEQWVELLLIVLNEFRWREVIESLNADHPQKELLKLWTQIEDSLVGSSVWQTELTAEKTVALNEFAQWFDQVMKLRRQDRTSPSVDTIRILPVEQLRHLPVSMMFLPGLTEDVFPQPGVNETLLSDDDRQAIARAVRSDAPPLRSLEESYCDELLLFHQLLSQAQTQVILSYPETNERGHPSYPSPFLLSVIEQFEAGIAMREHEGDLSPLPASNDIVTQADWRRLGTRMAIEGDFTQLQSYLSDHPQSVPFWKQALLMSQARWFTSGWTAYEGMLSDPAARQKMIDRYPPTRALSATLLQKYALCPFRMLLELALKVSPLAEPQLETDHRRRGIVLHQLMNDMHREPETREKGLHAAEIRERFLELVSRQFERPVSGPEIIAALNEIEQRLFTEWAERYAIQHNNYMANFAGWQRAVTPDHLELAFGDQVSGNPPLKIEYEGQEVLIEGRIDRVDVGKADDGSTRFSVVDYKTGHTKKFNDNQLQKGTSLQLMLYTLAVLRLELTGKDARPHQFGYWKIKKEGFEFGYSNRKKQTQLTDQLMTQLTQMLEPTVVKLAEHLRQAMFPVASSEKDCTDQCPYKTGCRIYEVRYVKERLNKQWAPTAAGQAEDDDSDE